MSFIVSALPAADFAPLFGLPEDALAERGIVRRTVAEAGSPCRLTLEDAPVGETVLLLNYEHQPANTPYRARHAIFVREGRETRSFAAGEIPPAFSARKYLSLRGFDEAGMMVDAAISPTSELPGAIDRLLGNPAIAYLHAHYAGTGCYAARIDRA